MMNTPAKLGFGLLLQAVVLVAWLAGCTTSSTMILDPSDGAPPRQLDPDSISDAVPRAEPISRYGNPERYTVFGKDYRVMANSQGYSERGIASWYGTKFHGRRTSSGEPYDMYSMTAAHKTLPLPTYVRVRNLTNGRSAIVRVNDRGPFHGNRIIDLSYAAATKLGILGKGTGLVEVVAIDPRHPQAPPLVAKQSTGSGVTAAPSMFIQIGAFSSLHNANRLRQRLQLSLDQPIRISEGNLRGETLFRVQVGPLKDVEQSDQISRELAQLGHDQLHIVIE